MEQLLSENEHALIEALAQRAANPNLRRRAQLLLLYDAGLPTREVAQRAGLSRGRARYWRKAFQVHKMGVFPAAPQELPPQPAVAAGEELPAPAAAQPGGSGRALPSPAEPAAPEPGPVNLSLEDLLQLHPDRPAAEHTSRLAQALFDATQEVHRLPAAARAALAAAAVLHDLPPLAAPAADDPAALLAGFSQIEKDLIEAIGGYQRGKARRQSLKRWRFLTHSEQAGLVLASLLRLAGALDASHTQSTDLQALASKPQALQLYVAGPHAEKDARAAQNEGELWTALFQQAIAVQVIDPLQTAALTPEELERLLSQKGPGVEPDDSLAEAGQKVLRFQFAEMIRHEDGTRRGDDIEELHDMRVATRRMRAAFEVFAEAFDPVVLKPHLKGSRATGRALGRVRDLDVFMEKAGHYLAAQPEELRHGLDPLLEAWGSQRASARAAMLEHLDSPTHLTYKRKFYHFLTALQPAAPDEPLPGRVRYIVPVLVYTRLAAVRSYAPRLNTATIEQLHGLRIEFKKLRYTLEYFREVLGPEVKNVIDAIKAVQDHLGDLNDAQVACQILRDFLVELEERQHALPMEQRQNPEPIVAYLAARHAERHRLMVSFQTTWDRFDCPELHTQLALAVSVL